jgi:hypothetical protein
LGCRAGLTYVEQPFGLRLGRAATTLGSRKRRMKWHPIADSSVRFTQLPGWVLQLTHNGSQTLGVWTNGRAVFTVPAALA